MRQCLTKAKSKKKTSSSGRQCFTYHHQDEDTDKIRMIVLGGSTRLDQELTSIMAGIFSITLKTGYYGVPVFFVADYENLIPNSLKLRQGMFCHQTMTCQRHSGLGVFDRFAQFFRVFANSRKCQLVSLLHFQLDSFFWRSQYSDGGGSDCVLNKS